MLKDNIGQVAMSITDVDTEGFLTEISTWQMEVLEAPHSLIRETIINTLDTVLDVFFDNCNYL